MKLIRKPFKGTFMYEWQIGPIVFQIRHKGSPYPFRLFNVWRDSQWKA